MRRAGCWPASSPAACCPAAPIVSWVSTQHNLIAWFFLSSVDDKVDTGLKPSELDKVTNGIADGIERNLIVSVDATHSAFVQGVKDTVRPLDVQTLGLLFLEASGRGKSGKLTTADKVKAYLTCSAYAVSGRSIVKSSEPASFNQTYSAAGPFSGYRPYAARHGPGRHLGRGHRAGALRAQGAGREHLGRSTRRSAPGAASQRRARSARTARPPTRISTNTTCGRPRPPRAGR